MSDKYFPRLLAEILHETGLVFMAVCSGGAALEKPGNGGALFVDLLDQVPAGVRFLIPVICGNDFYETSVRPLGGAVRGAAVAFCAKARRVSKTQFAVLGMSAATWQYTSWMTGSSAAQYDVNCDELVRICCESNVYAERGVDELAGLKLADSIGHVHVDSERAVFDAYKVWVRA